MKRRRCLLLLGLLAGLFVLGAGAWLLWPRTAITRENAAKIKEGMTLAEAEAILGGPARDETTGPCRIDVPEADDGVMERRWILVHAVSVALRPARRIVWQSDVVLVSAQVHEGRLTSFDFVPMQRVEESLVDMLRRWFRL